MSDAELANAMASVGFGLVGIAMAVGLPALAVLAAMNLADVSNAALARAAIAVCWVAAALVGAGATVLLAMVGWFSFGFVVRGLGL